MVVLCSPNAARPAHDRQEQLVDVHLPFREPLAPAPVELGREVVGKGGVERDVGAAPDHVVVDREPRAADRAQHRVAQLGAVVELVAVGGLEQQAAEVDRLHQQPVARLQRDVVDMARVRQMRAGRLLAPGRFGGAQGR